MMKTFPPPAPLSLPCSIQTQQLENLPWRRFCRLGRWKIHWCGPVCMCVVAVAVAKEDTTGKRPLCAACNSFYRQWIWHGDANQVANCWHLVLKSNMSNSGGKESIVPLLKSTISVKAQHVDICNHICTHIFTFSVLIRHSFYQGGQSF